MLAGRPVTLSVVALLRSAVSPYFARLAITLAMSPFVGAKRAANWAGVRNLWNCALPGVWSEIRNASASFSLGNWRTTVTESGVAPDCIFSGPRSTAVGVAALG